MENCEAVAALRRRLHGNATEGVLPQPGVYRWWFADNDATARLLAPLGELEMQRVQRRTIGGKVYLALYFGIAKNLSERIAWHVGQRHTESTVRHGFLSTLRQTISALMGKDMTAAQDDVDIFQDANCVLEYGYMPSRDAAEEAETAEIAANYYPLNLSKNPNVGRTALRKLSNLRKTFKK